MPRKKKQELGPYQEAWVQTLESGELRQATGALCIKSGDDWRYCCLGAACEMLRQNGVRGVEAKLVHGGTTCLYGSKADLLPIAARAALKTVSGNPGNFRQRDLPSWAKRKVSPESDGLSLIALNDAHGFTFKQIARLIRQKPELFFTGPA